MILQNSLNSIDKWQCLFMEEISRNLRIKKPFPITFKFIFKNPYYTIYAVNQKTEAEIPLSEKLLLKHLDGFGAKLENDYHQVEIEFHTFYQINNMKLIFKETDNLFIYY